MGFYRNDDFRLADLYRQRKRARKTKPLLGITLKKKHKGDGDGEGEDKGFTESDVNNSDFSYQLNSRLLIKIESQCDETADYSEKMRKIKEALLLKYQSCKDLIPGCGSLDEYETLHQINRGSFGVVYRALHKRSGEIVAVKQEVEGLSASSLREMHILTSLPRHPRIVHLKEVVVDDVDGLFLVMDFMDYDLRRYIKVKPGDLSLAEIKNLMKQLLEGVSFLHQNMVMHRDIKPANILVNKEGVLKICDFGMSRRFKAEGGSYSPHVGTLPYKAPELLEGETAYTRAVDMWGVGCTMAEVLMRKVLFLGRPTRIGQLHAIHKIVGTPEKPAEINLLRDRLSSGGAAPPLSEAGVDLVSKLLSYDPAKRITAESALNHDWFQE